jgi:hypothetical protein
MRFFASIAAIAIVAGAANADTVNLKFANVGQGRNVQMTIGSSSFNCFAGQLVHTFSNGNGAAAGLTSNMITFCSDLTQGVSTAMPSTYTVTGIQNLPVTSGFAAMGNAKKQAIYDMYAAAGGQQMASDADMAAAFQLAIWEVIYDYNGTASSLNLSSGQLKAKNMNGATLASGVSSKATQLFSAIGMNVAQSGLMGLSSPYFQDQILQTLQLVPLPTAALAGLTGLGGLMVMRRRMRLR